MSDRPTKITPRSVIRILVYCLVLPFLPLLISRRWDWWEAWVLAIVCIGGFAASRLVVAQRSPDLIAERARFTQHKDIMPWDRILAPLVGLGTALIPLAAGLEALQGGNFLFSVPVKGLALIIILAGYALGSYTLYEKRFFSGVVRIQSDRGQHVVSAGPYGWVRHPGYAGAMATYLAIPVFLDSVCALMVAVLLVIALVIRTSLEDKTLQEELEGYRGYAQQVRYRLVPGVW